MAERDDDTFEIAVRHYVDEDYESSVVFFQKLLEEGEPSAGTYLGGIYEDGLLGDVDLDKALNYYLAGAELGSKRCKFHAAIVYGKKGKIDFAVKQLEEVAQDGFMLAQSLLGFWYREGLYVKKDKERAISYLRAASEQGHIEATGEYANILRHQGGLRNSLIVVSLVIRAMWSFIRFNLFKKDDDVFELTSKISLGREQKT